MYTSMNVDNVHIQMCIYNIYNLFIIINSICGAEL